MNRTIALLATASLAAAGCTSRQCDVPSVNVYWSFTDATGHALGCTGAGVASIRLFVDGTAADPSTPDFACAPYGNGVEGITLLDFQGGSTHSLQVEGYDANGALLYLDQRSFTVGNNCGSTDVYANLASQAADMTVSYAFRPAAGCTPVTAQSAYDTTFIWYELVDQNGQVYSTSNQASSPNAIPCSAGGAIQFQGAPFGQYNLTRIEEVELLADGRRIIYHYNCQPQTLNHLQAGDDFVVTMVQQAAGGVATCF